MKLSFAFFYQNLKNHTSFTFLTIIAAPLLSAIAVRFLHLITRSILSICHCSEHRSKQNEIFFQFSTHLCVCAPRCLRWHASTPLLTFLCYLATQRLSVPLSLHADTVAATIVTIAATSWIWNFHLNFFLVALCAHFSLSTFW